MLAELSPRPRRCVCRQRRAEAAEAERRLANAARDLNAPDAALEQAEAVRRPSVPLTPWPNPKAKPDALAAAARGRRSPRGSPGRTAVESRAQPPGWPAPSVPSTSRRPSPTPPAPRRDSGRSPPSWPSYRSNKKGEAAGQVARAAELADRAEQIDEDNAGPARPTPGRARRRPHPRRGGDRRTRSPAGEGGTAAGSRQACDDRRGRSRAAVEALRTWPRPPSWSAASGSSASGSWPCSAATSSRRRRSAASRSHWGRS